GMVGQWLGANAPDRVEKLVLSNTNSYYDDKTPWIDRIKLVTEKGLDALVDTNMQRWFTEGFRKRAPEVIAGEIIQNAIKGAKLASLDAAHISNMEQPKQYTDTVVNVLRG